MNGNYVKIRIMKTKIKHIVTTVMFIMMSAAAIAQPLPPSTPNGNSVPVGGSVVILFIVMAGLGFKQLLKNRKLE